ncbi:hypothetical protein CC80DRAFT_511507 [Byssothecium circinans]|uniref:Uncharacterized protein n=1 Tax=Byssothecium circinans TaxID=147558 RepID=A0A6A5T6N3_9PLEO|nr:hypothetical protein CC80DRAFT_556563 [Byssothecium circinans]KAF1948230.1 hypothetical protein CC80DRAFT_511507 [Byssothecium circinans]
MKFSPLSTLLAFGLARHASSSPTPAPRANNAAPLNYSAFADWLQVQPPTTVPPNMGRYAYETTIDGVCHEFLTVNWNCLYNITVTGPNMAASLRNFTAGPTGGRIPYFDVETGYDWHGNMWAYVLECSNWYPKSACGMVICCDKKNNAGFYSDPNSECPQGTVEDSSCSTTGNAKL